MTRSFRSLALWAVSALSLLAVGGCGTTSTSDLNAAVTQLHQSVVELQAQPQATTQAAAQLAKIETNLAKVQKVTEAIASKQDPVEGILTGVGTAAPLAGGPLAGYLELGSVVGLALYALIKRAQVIKGATALTQTANGLQQALATGQLTATKGASEIVDSNLTVTHPGSDAVVDVIKAATK